MLRFLAKHRQRFELVLYDFLSSSAISAFQMHRQEVQRWSSAKAVQPQDLDRPPKSYGKKMGARR